MFVKGVAHREFLPHFAVPFSSPLWKVKFSISHPITLHLLRQS